MKQTACCVCGTEFGLSDELMQSRRDDGETLYCPNGHGLSFRPSGIEKLRQKNQKLTQQVQTLTARLEQSECMNDWYVQRVRSTDKELTLQKRRVAGYKSQWLRVKRQLAR